jgi:hypothetical protein
VSPFDFVCAFYSVVLGVAVAQLMTGVARLIEERDRVRWYWVQGAWVLTVLLGDVGNWWSMWQSRSVKNWSIYTFLLLIALIGSIYVMTVLLFPRISPTEEPIDLDQHYYKSRRIFFWTTFTSWALALVCNWTLFPIELSDPWIIIPAIMLVLSIVATLTANRIYHAIFAVLGLVAMILVLVVEGAWIG